MTVVEFRLGKKAGKMGKKNSRKNGKGVKLRVTQKVKLVSNFHISGKSLSVALWV
jgi:hypothetical protein